MVQQWRFLDHVTLCDACVYRAGHFKLLIGFDECYSQSKAQHFGEIHQMMVQIAVFPMNKFRNLHCSYNQFLAAVMCNCFSRCNSVSLILLLIELIFTLIETQTVC